MTYISYSQLRSWRDICEFLDQSWYNFASVQEIRCGCPKALPNLYSFNGRAHRQWCWGAGKWGISYAY